MLNREEALLHADLADATTGRTLNRVAAFLGAAALAGLANDLRRYVDLDVVACNGFLEIEL